MLQRHRSMACLIRAEQGHGLAHCAAPVPLLMPPRIEGANRVPCAWTGPLRSWVRRTKSTACGKMERGYLSDNVSSGIDDGILMMLY